MKSKISKLEAKNKFQKLIKILIDEELKSKFICSRFHI